MATLEIVLLIIGGLSLFGHLIWLGVYLDLKDERNIYEIGYKKLSNEKIDHIDVEISVDNGMVTGVCSGYSQGKMMYKLEDFTYIPYLPVREMITLDKYSTEEIEKELEERKLKDNNDSLDAFEYSFKNFPQKAMGFINHSMRHKPDWVRIPIEPLPADYMSLFRGRIRDKILSLDSYSINLPDKVFFNKKKKATTLVRNGQATVVKCVKGDKYSKRIGFLEAYFQMASGISKTQSQKYLDKILEEE